MFHLLEFEIGILVLKYMYRYIVHHLMYNCYPETLCIHKKISLFTISHARQDLVKPTRNSSIRTICLAKLLLNLIKDTHNAATTKFKWQLGF